MHDKNLHFILNKITEIDIALMHSKTEGLLTIPTTIVSTYKADHMGYILLFMPRPTQLISGFQKEFPAELSYFKKGFSCYMNIYGDATLVSEPEELYSYDLSAKDLEEAMTNKVLVKVKVLKAEYFENEENSKTTVFEKIRGIVAALLEKLDWSGKSLQLKPKPQMQ